MKILRGLLGMLMLAGAGSMASSSVSCGGVTAAGGTGGSSAGSGGNSSGLGGDSSGLGGMAGAVGTAGAGMGGSVGGFGGSAPIPPGVLDESRIPTGHPRLFFNAERLAQAKQWFASHPFTPDGDEPIDDALHYLLSGNAQSARRAIDYALGITFSTSGTASDPARWEGERVILAYDWCYDRMTETERNTIIDRWNGYLDAINQKSWGGVGMEGNNYYTGYMRNNIEWGIATYRENPRAAAILQNGLTTRWTDSFLPYSSSFGEGGVPHEGTQYGRDQLAYFVIPLTTGALMGRDMWKETNYFKQLAFHFIYSMTAAKISLKERPANFYETFPYNDDETWRYGDTAALAIGGGYLGAVLEEWPDTNLAGYVQQYLTTTAARLPLYMQSVLRPATARPFSNLALDYFAPGAQFFYTRNSWNADATNIVIQLGIPIGVGHNHFDAGSFHIARKSRWLSRETVAYAEELPSWNNGPARDARAGFGHNTILFNGEGPVDDWRGSPVVLRMESRTNHSYIATDLTPTYRSDDSGNDLPYVGKFVREFLFIRPLETLVIFDRMRVSTANTVRSFIVHSEMTSPTISGGNTLITNGDQALQVMTLVPASVTPRVVNEMGGVVGQYRVEIDNSGATESHFLTVLHGRDMSASALQATVSDTGSAYQVTLTHPSRGSATVTFQKGMDSTGGAFGYAASGSPTASPLIDGKQVQRITDDGPIWQ
jgi:hypothetical protein